MFTCCECEHKYIPDVTGDAEERMCFECLDKEDIPGFEGTWKQLGEL